MSNLEGKFSQFEKRFNVMAIDVRATKDYVGVVRNDIRLLKSDMKSLKSDMSFMKSDMKFIRKNLAA